MWVWVWFGVCWDVRMCVIGSRMTHVVRCCLNLGCVACDNWLGVHCHSVPLSHSHSLTPHTRTPHFFPFGTSCSIPQVLMDDVLHPPAGGLALTLYKGGVNTIFLWVAICVAYGMVSECGRRA